MNLYQHFFSVVVLALLPLSVHAVDVTVNPASVIKTVPKTPLGVALNQMVDGTLSLDSLKNVVIQSGAKFLRFPEGETSDNYYFTDPTYLSNPKPSTARVANIKYWPVGTSLANSNGTYAKGLNFDQFMSVATAAGATANIVLCYPCGDKVKALEMAKAWVKYSKDKGYNVLNWEIGNETFIYNPNYTDEYQMSVAEYAKDIVEWSTALKAIDPRIKIGVNGKTKEWFNAILQYRHPSLNAYGSQVVDFLAVHLYPMYGSSFAAYQKNQNAYGVLNFLSDVNPALNALLDSAAVSNTSHIKVSITETSTTNYSSSSDPNDMGSAIMTADLMTELLKHPLIDYVGLWASRWIKNFSTATAQGSDTFSSKNKLNASGLAMSALSKFTRDKIVNVSGGTTTLKVFASISSSTGEVSVMLLNRSDFAQTVSLSIIGATSLAGKKYSFNAASVTSTSPTFDSTGVAIKSTSGNLSLSVPKTSFLFINFTGLRGGI